LPLIFTPNQNVFFNLSGVWTPLKR
jgi:hypothetical protein